MFDASNVSWDDPARRLCWLGRQYAFLFGKEYVGIEHLLMAATEVTPTDWHSCPHLTRDGILQALEEIEGKTEGTELAERRPNKLTPRARAALGRAVDRAGEARRPVGVRDVWAGLLSDGDGLAIELLTRVGVEPEYLRTRLA